ncbi:MAG: hypothetical protein U0872_01075 [Planctomycetaceae bacterium]
MDVLQRMMRQFFELYRSMSPSQRGTLIAVPLLVIGGFAVLLWQQRGGSETALSFGKIYSTEEVIAAEEALMKANLTEFRRVGGRIMVPANQVDRYNAALLEFDAMPADLGSQMLKQLESMGPLSTDKQRAEMKEAMLLQEMRRMLRKVPDIEDARVVVASSGRRQTWSQKSRVTATVQVTPRGGRELSQKLVHGIRSAVASMVPDLQPGDVTVFDRIHGVSYTGDAADDPFDSKLMQRIREFSQEYERKISNDLSYIPNVIVTAHVDVENVKSSVTKSQTVDKGKIVPIFESETKVTDNQQQQMPRGEAGVRGNRGGRVQEPAAVGQNRTRQQLETETNTLNGVSFEVTEKALIAAMPKAVQVSVSIPRDYYRDVVAQRKAAGEQEAGKLDIAQVEQEVMTDVRKSVAQLVPASSQSAAVVVKSVDRLQEPSQDPKLPWSEQLTQWGQEWGGAVALALFAIWVLRTLRKMGSAPGGSTADTEFDAFDSQQLKLKNSTSAEAPHEDQPREPTRRDLIQTVVKDNPEMTAAVIGRWLQQAAK